MIDNLDGQLQPPLAKSPPIPVEYPGSNNDDPDSYLSFKQTDSKIDAHNAAEPMITIENLSKSYPDGTVGLVNVSLKLYDGELTCIAGENGQGKSTLLRLLALDDKPTEGKIIVLNQDVSQLSARERDNLRGEAIEYIPQGHLGLVSQTALMNVAYWLHYYDAFPWNKAKEVGRQVLKDVGLPDDKFDVHVRKLSGGQRARVAIAKAFARNRPICLGDEIFAALDQQHAIELIQLFRVLAHQGATVIVIVHQEQLWEHFDRVIILRDTRLVEDRYNLIACSK